MSDILQGAKVVVYRTILKCTCADKGLNHSGSPCPNAYTIVLEQVPQEERE